MIYAVKFEDDSAFEMMRARYMEDHLSFLESHSDLILSAGPLTETSQTEPDGGLWIVNAENEEIVKELVEKDPFRRTGLRRAIYIYEWKQVFSEGKRQI